MQRQQLYLHVRHLGGGGVSLTTAEFSAFFPLIGPKIEPGVLIGGIFLPQDVGSAQLHSSSLTIFVINNMLKIVPYRCFEETKISEKTPCLLVFA
jgi:hypothetical protein